MKVIITLDESIDRESVDEWVKELEQMPPVISVKVQSCNNECTSECKSHEQLKKD